MVVDHVAETADILGEFGVEPGHLRRMGIDPGEFSHVECSIDIIFERRKPRAHHFDGIAK